MAVHVGKNASVERLSVTRWGDAAVKGRLRPKPRFCRRLSNRTWVELKWAHGYEDAQRRALTRRER